MSNYCTLLQADQLVELTEGMCDVDESIYTVTVETALVELNYYNIGKYHPDVYVIVKHEGKEVLEMIESGSNEITRLATNY